MRSCMKMAELEGTSSGGVESLVDKKRGISAVWAYFGFERTDVDEKKATCRICRCVAASRQKMVLTSVCKLNVIQYLILICFSNCQAILEKKQQYMML